MKKIVVIGSGDVGAHIVSTSIHKNLKAEFFLIDLNESLEKSQVLDLKDSLSFAKNTKVEQADFGDEKIKDADIFIITAGVRQRENETRVDLLERNANILKKIKNALGEIKKESIILIVTNPVDLLTEISQDIFKLPRGQVFGSGTVLDSSRLKWKLGEFFDKNPEKINGMVLAEHGDYSFVQWSKIRNSEKISQNEKNEIQEFVRNEAYEIIDGKGSTYFGISSAVVEILDSIINNRRKIFPLSVHLDGEYGFKYISIGVPVKVGKNGMKIVKNKLSENEEKMFKISGEKLKNILDEYYLR